MKAKIILLILIGFVSLSSCNKKANTQATEDYFMYYNVKIAKKIKEPTVIAGFFGKVMKYEGNFQPQVSDDSTNTTRQPEPARNAILVFLPEQKEAIEETKYEENGVTFYNLKALKNKKVIPKYRFVPNKWGFYQMDLGDGTYHMLLEVKGNKGYFNGGLSTITASATNLMELELRVDYKASF